MRHDLRDSHCLPYVTDEQTEASKVRRLRLTSHNGRGRTETQVSRLLI